MRQGWDHDRRRPAAIAVAVGAAIVMSAIAVVSLGMPPRATASSPTLLGPADGTNSQAGGINSSGQIVGAVGTNAELWTPPATAGGPYTAAALPTLGGATGHANATNDAGQIVGTSDTIGAAPHATVWSGEAHTPTDLGTVPGFTGSGFDATVLRSEAMAINIGGQAAGWSEGAATTVPQAVVWNPPPVAGAPYVQTSLLSGSGSTSIAYGINDGGTVVGVSAPAAVLWVPPASPVGLYSQVTLGGLGGPFDEARGINNAGTVVGASSDGTQLRAVLWNPPAVAGGSYSGAVKLPDLDGVTHSRALAINGVGQIVGGSLVGANQAPHAVIWNPPAVAGGSYTVSDLGALPLASGETPFAASAAGINGAGVAVVTANAQSSAAPVTHGLVWAPPLAPAAPTAVAGDRSATITWTPPSDGGAPITSYTVTPYFGSTKLSGTTVNGSPPAPTATVGGLTNGTGYTFVVTAANALGVSQPSPASNRVIPTPPPTPSSTPSPTPPPVLPAAGSYQGIQPTRICDTRPAGTGGVLPNQCDTGSGGGSLGANQSRAVQVCAGFGGPSACTLGAVALNVTIVTPSAPSYLTVYPTGAASPPLAANLNYGPGDIRANLVMVKVGAGGMVSLYNQAGSVDVVVDLEGAVPATGGPVSGSPGLFHPLPPSRICDTRVAGSLGVVANPCDQAGDAPLQPGETRDLQVTGHGGVPGAGVSAVVVNVTVTDTRVSGSYLTAWPAGNLRPLAANLNWGPRQTVPNRVVVPVGHDGKVSFFNALGTAELVVDVNGWYGDGSDGGGTRFTATAPTRICDTRAVGTGGAVANQCDGSGASTLGKGGTLTVQATGTTPTAVPAGSVAMVANVTVTGTTAGSFLTAWPADTPQPLAADLNWVPQQTVPNLVVVKVSAATPGKVSFYNALGSTDVVIDVNGYYS